MTKSAKEEPRVVLTIHLIVTVRHNFYSHNDNDSHYNGSINKLKVYIYVLKSSLYVKVVFEMLRTGFIFKNYGKIYRYKNIILVAF